MALYHRYRPQLFSSVVGQDHVVQTLVNEIREDALAHAYLFSGPRGVGKTTLARLLAKAINCEKKGAKTGEPCNSCSTCEEISSGRSIDVIEIDAASHTGVDNVRENIIENAQFKPTKSSYKIFIIDEVHMLSTSAFNALLKTLEEPPKHVLFILATTELQKLPDTIISRCQRFTFKKIPYETMKAHLLDVAKQEKVKIDTAVLDRVINKSDGCARDALSLLDQLFSTGEKNITIDVASAVLPTSPVEETMAFVTACVRTKAADGLIILNTLADSGANFMQFATDAVELIRGMMIKSISNELPVLTLDVGDEVRKQLETLVKDIPVGDLVRLADLFLKRRLEIRSAPIPQLPLELLILEWCNPTISPPTPPSSTSPGVKSAPVASVAAKVTVPPTIQAPVADLEPHAVPEKKTITERVREFVAGEPLVTKAHMLERWPEFTKAIEHVSPSLVFILKMAEVENVEGNTLIISVPYTFHRDKLMDKTCHHQIVEQLERIVHAPLKLEVVINEERQQSMDDEPSQELQNLAAALGGEVAS